MEMMNVNEELRTKISSVQKYLYECEKDESIFQAINLFKIEKVKVGDTNEEYFDKTKSIIFIKIFFKK